MKQANNVLCQNKKAYFDYEILEKYQAGLVLLGTEIKSLRLHKASFVDAYCEIRKGEIFVKGLHISKYEMGNLFNHEPDRDKKLLLTKKEILKLQNKIPELGFTIVPLNIYLQDGLAKIEIAVARGKKNYDKRETLKQNDQKRAISKALKGEE
jgi:SsrA-binding protein